MLQEKSSGAKITIYNKQFCYITAVIITAWLTGGMSLFICGFVCLFVWTNGRHGLPTDSSSNIMSKHIVATNLFKSIHICHRLLAENLSFFILFLWNVLMSSCRPQHPPTDLRGTSLKARSVVLVLSRLEALQPSPRHIRKPLAPFVLFLLCWAVCGRSSRHGFSRLK